MADAGAAPHLRLLVPGLLGPLPGMQGADFPWPACPTLERLLGRAEPHPGPTTPLAVLPTHFLDSPRLQGAAALSWLGEFGHLPPAAVLRADPVHLRADRDQLLLFGPETLDLEAGEFEALAAAFNAHFRDEGLRLQPTPEGRGYLHLARHPEIQTLPLERMLGRPVTDFLAGGKERERWRRWLTEVQMLFANHHVNLRRQVEGRPSVNGLWLWGEGPVPPPRPNLNRSLVLHADDPIFRGTAMHCDLHVAPRGEPAETFRSPSDHEEHWFLFDHMRPLAAYGELEGWRHAVAAFDQDWLQPAFAALRAGRIRLLDLVPMNGRLYRLRWHRSWIPWRRAHPSAHVQHD